MASAVELFINVEDSINAEFCGLIVFAIIDSLTAVLSVVISVEFVELLTVTKIALVVDSAEDSVVALFAAAVDEIVVTEDVDDPLTVVVEA
jgi:hypothetical protein